MQNAECQGDAITIRGISKSFGKIKALDDINLIVEPNTVFALLGPNGSPLALVSPFGYVAGRF